MFAQDAKLNWIPNRNRKSLIRTRGNLVGSRIPLFYTRDFIHAKLFCREKGGARESLWSALITSGHRWRVQCPLCPRMRVQKKRERSPNQRASRLFGVLYRWLDRWTRLPANVLTPRALESMIQWRSFSEIQEREISKYWGFVVNQSRLHSSVFPLCLKLGQES